MENKVDIELIPALSGEYTAKISAANGHSTYWHSSISPTAEAEQWVKYILLKNNTAYFVLGFGMGYHVKKLLDELPDQSYIYVLEPKREFNLPQRIFQSLSELGQDMEWMKDKRIIYYASGDVRDIAADVSNDILRKRLKRMAICKHYSTMKIEKEFYSKIEEFLMDKIEELFYLNFNTRSRFAKMNIQNVTFNMPFIKDSIGTTGLKNKFKGKPAIIISAGPSLDKNIDLLRQCSQKALLVASGSAMGALHHNGIVPHVLATLDSQDIAYEMDLKGTFDNKTMLLAAYTANNKVISNYPGKIMFCKEKEEGLSDYLKKYFPPTDTILANISVATMAVNFALYCGAEPIIFVGQDLAFSNSQYHATGVQASKYDKFELVEVPGYYGRPVQTTKHFKDVIQYFETLVGFHHSVRFINATEGGAYISGAESLSLQEVLNRYLKKIIYPDRILYKVLKKNDKLVSISELERVIEKMVIGAEELAQKIIDFEKNMLKKDDFQGVFLKDKLYSLVVSSESYLYLKTPINVCLDYMEYRYASMETKESQNNLIIYTIKEILDVISVFIEAVNSKK